MRVEEIPAEATHDLRRRILRGSRPDAVVGFPEDDRPGAFHLAVRHDDTTLAVASFSVEGRRTGPGIRPSVSGGWPSTGHSSDRASAGSSSRR